MGGAGFSGIAGTGDLDGQPGVAGGPAGAALTGNGYINWANTGTRYGALQ